LILVVVLAAFGAGIWGLHRYLASRQVADEVAARLHEKLGIPVQIGRVDVGPKHTSLEDVQLFEPGADPSASQPWATIQEARVDVTALDLLRGKALPRHVTLKGLTVILRHNESGERITRLPAATQIIKTIPHPPRETTAGALAAIPEIHFKDARLILRQQGRPDMVLNGIEADLRSDGDELVLSGRVADPDWGTWNAMGEMNRETQVGRVALHTVHPLPITQAMLKRLPIVSPRVWKQVEVEGGTPVELSVRFDAPAETVRYRALLEPRAVKVCVPCVELCTDQVQGRVVVEDSRVKVESLQGQAAGGEVKTNGAIDFSGPILRLKLKVRVEKVRMARLPKSWAFPPGVTGRLTGDAKFHTVVVDGQPAIRGSGTGAIKDARLDKIPTSPIPLNMVLDSAGFHFTVPSLARLGL
jgi:hypothetical protein